MQSNTKLLNSLDKIFTILSLNKNINFKDLDLIRLDNNQIITPIGDIFPFFNKKTNPFPDELIEINLIKNLITILSKQNAIIRLNHIGFCYKASLLNTEKTKIINLSKNSNIHLYQEPSNDEGLWFFLGDISNWQETTIELVPIQNTNDPGANYWLPHIQIDIDTTLTAKEIITLVNSVFNCKIRPFPINIDGITYIVRNRLGIINGINIFLDLATCNRDVKNLKQKIWKKIV